MKWWQFLFGGNGETVKAIGDAIDQNVTSDEERGAQQLQDDAQARSFAAPAIGKGAIFDLIAAWNSAIRPGMTTWVTLACAGVCSFPPPDSIDPFWEQVILIVLTFWFGGRMLLKDLPSALASIAELRAKWGKK